VVAGLSCPSQRAEESDKRPDPELDPSQRTYYRLTGLGRRLLAAEVERVACLAERNNPQQREGKPWPVLELDPKYAGPCAVLAQLWMYVGKYDEAESLLRRALARQSAEALKIIERDPDLNLRYQLLRSAKGIGPVSAIQILAELGVVSEGLDVRQYVAYAGLDPREHSSGTSVHKKVRISKAGNAHLRRALYMPALVAIRHQPNLRAFYRHLRDGGKLKMVALVAVMRKLLHAIYGMFKHHQPFDGAKVYQLPQEASLPQPSLSTAEAA